MGYRVPPCLPFADCATHLAELGALRQEHNMSPDNVIEAAARALRCVVPVRHWDRFMGQCPKV